LPARIGAPAYYLELTSSSYYNECYPIWPQLMNPLNKLTSICLSFAQLMNPLNKLTSICLSFAEIKEL